MLSRRESALKEAESRGLDSRPLLEAQARIEAALGQTRRDARHPHSPPRTVAG